MRTWEILIVMAFCLFIPGCVNTLQPSDTREPPSVFIIHPPFDGGIMAGNVTIVVEVTNFSLVSPGEKNSAATGHLIYYRDVVPPVLEGVPAFTRPGTYGVSYKSTYGWDRITPGTHTFAVQLVNADNTPLNPPVVDAIDVTAVAQEMISNS